MTVADLETLGPGDEQAEVPRDSSGKKIAGRSPTRIALERLRKDKVAIVSRLDRPHPRPARRSSRRSSEVLRRSAVLMNTRGVQDLDLATGGYPAVGPPFHPFTWDHPLGLTPNTAYDNLARLLYGLRVSLVIALGATVFSTHHRHRDGPDRRLRPRLGRPDHLVHRSTSSCRSRSSWARWPSLRSSPPASPTSRTSSSGPSSSR